MPKAVSVLEAQLHEESTWQLGFHVDRVSLCEPPQGSYYSLSPGSLDLIISAASAAVLVQGWTWMERWTLGVTALELAGGCRRPSMALLWDVP